MAISRNAAASPEYARSLFRTGTIATTSGWASGYTQTNLIAVPQGWAYDVLLFAQRNPKSCPVLDVSDPGTPATILAPTADLRTDYPLYRIWEDGELVEETPDARPHWRDDLVAFHIGCSFTFEAMLADAGVPIRHLEQLLNVPMYVTNRQCRPAGRVRGPLVVSMRPIPRAQVGLATSITARMPGVHGSPVHVGDPSELGIANLDLPDFGDAVDVLPGDVPVFWACGVTPQAAVVDSKVSFAITHAPGHMLITDTRDAEYLLDTAARGAP